MTAIRSHSGAYQIVESDAAVDAILKDCQMRGTVRIEDRDGRPYELHAAESVKENSDEKLVTDLPDFAARRAKLGPPLPKAAQDEFFRLLRGE
jgi:hypothetical protein